MYALEKIKHDLAAEFSRTLKVQIKASDFVTAPNPDLGDLSLPCFALVKQHPKVEVGGQIPTAANIASMYAASLSNIKWIDKMKAVGPYLNITLNQSVIEKIISQISYEKKSYGLNKSGSNKRVMVEYSNANTHKEYHVGHLRNIAYGDAVNRILAANGWKTIPVSYINDFGIHVAKTIWWLLGFSKDKKADFSQAYQKATLALKDYPDGNKEVSKIMKQIESRRGDMYKLWKKTRQWNIDQFSEIYKELGVNFQTIFYENEFLKSGLKMVKELEEKGILKKSEGAVIADLEKYNLGVLVVLRSDGTALYPVADLPLAIQKVKKYKLDTSLYVVDIRQGLYFNQLFKILELLGLETKFDHLPYEFVKLPSGMMSSRTGNIITYEEVKDMALTKAKTEIIKRHSGWPIKKINHVASVVAFGALKFEMIKVSANKQITFDVDQALRFDGFTAAYLQYTYARLQSIFRKTPTTLKRLKVDYNCLVEAREKSLALKLAEFPKAVKTAGETKDPAEIAKYLFDLAQLTNDYYHAVPVLKAQKLEARARLELLQSVAFVIAQGLELLGIETVEEM